jgi:cobalamin biosynthesis Mg chelatase CobN
VLALLAFACFPVLAQAENVYEFEETQIPGQVEKPHSNSGHKNTHSGGSSPEAQKSTSPEGGGGGNTGGESPESESHKQASAGGGNPSNPGGGGPAQGKQGKGGANVKAQPGSGGAQKIEPVSSTTNDEGSSSPLVPILIAVAVLAAISVGAVVVRQRRQRAGGQVSPKAS